MKKIYYFAISILVALPSCSFLDLSPNVISKETFYKSELEAKYGLSGVYGAMNHYQFYGNYFSLMLSGVDDLCYFNRAPQSSTAAPQYRYDASTTEIYEAWTRIYAGIRNANAFMAAIDGSEYDPDGGMYNEARFLRAYYHFVLAQAWGDVPMRKEEVTEHKDVLCAASPQYEVLSWAASEMEECLGKAAEDPAIQPSRVTATTIHGILSRVYLFMAGASVKGGDKKGFMQKAMEHADEVISSGLHRLNPDYSQVFINMIKDQYDTEYHESMWEVEFLGDRSSASSWSNGRIGDVIGLQSTGSSDYATFKCNYSYGMYDGSLKLWDLYWATDRTEDEYQLGRITDVRQEWNLPPYNYSGSNNPPYGSDGSDGKTKSLASIDKTPYAYNSVTTTQDPTAAQAIRNCGKYRREVEYEGVKTAKNLWTTINYPLLRYSDVLLMYAEASNEYEGAPSRKAYDCVKLVRDRAGIKTLPYESYDRDSFRELVRNERGRELCFESLRKYDLIRWGIFVKAMNEYGQWTADERWNKNTKSGYAAAIGEAVADRHVCLPIPNIELGVNTLLVQNPLW
ncbi:MAG: RagB/SusD family nutrient uptake outer membrane protein [Bacteroidales bacterium]|nr:RagB/SusD family nutrient uptake outer membrane protein [Bacteroidales bacterium]